MPTQINISRDTAQKLAEQYGLRSSENLLFDLSWSMNNAGRCIEAVTHDESEALVKLGLKKTADTAKSGRSAGTLGHHLLKSLPVKGRYVVFSDHHMNHQGNRQNFMVTSSNMDLYVEVLEQYAHNDYTVIENGDLEELLVVEPETSEVTERLAPLAEGGLNVLPDGRVIHATPTGNLESISAADPMANRLLEPFWAALAERRGDVREDQLFLILGDEKNARYYRVMADLSKAGKLIRVAGNHDYDLQKPRYQAIMQSSLGAFDPPVDYLMLVDDEAPAGQQTRFVIMHGHQFDRSCVPELAPKLGEIFSENMAWAYQGSDRHWPWLGGGAPCVSWATAQRAFNNALVTDDPGTSGPGPNNAVVGGLIGTLTSKDGWEQLFGHPIAWNYFRNADDPELAIKDEVKTGESFFKYRHLDEVVVHREWVKHFPDPKTRPVLVLGHTHEVRSRPAYYHVEINPQGKAELQKTIVDHYLNSGAAGRFENLIWAVEIVDGVANVVSWSRPQPKVGQAQRRWYTEEELNNGMWALRASQQPVPLPGEDQVSSFSYTRALALLHTMMR